MSGQRKYRVWPAAEHEHDGGAMTYMEYEPRQAALKYADHFHAQRHGWECSWPFDFIVRDLGEKYPFDEAGQLYKYNVERESVPHFTTSYKQPDELKLEPGIHDRIVDREYVCACCHPIGFAGECLRCFCASGKRFFTVDDGGASYTFVARDVEHCKQLLRDVGAEFTKEDGDSAPVDDPAFADLDWQEHTQDDAKCIRCHPDDGGKPAQPLTTYELGTWFSSEY